MQDTSVARYGFTMDALSRLLFGFGLAAFALGALWCGWHAGTLNGGWTLVVGVATRSFEAGGGLLALTSVTVFGVTAALASGAEWWLARHSGARTRGLEPLPAGTRELIREVSRRVTADVSKADPDVVSAFDELLRGAAVLQASDLHVSPTPSGLKITYRIHGVLHDVATLERRVLPRLATRVKVLARLDPAQPGVPQDGRLVRTLAGSSIEARVSTLPTEIGERLVLRLVSGSQVIPSLESLGFPPALTGKLAELLSKPQGLLFVTGPVGSGKTTTLYAAMRHIAEHRGRTTHIVTLEDPIEVELPFATQTQMNAKAGMTFASTLRSVLRQDPNVLLVGEIRDRETAEIAMQAGLTGHFIVTTVHGEGAAGPFARLMEMQVEPFAVASATLGCLAQRLVRTLCTACRRPAEPEPELVERLTRLGHQLPDGTYYEPVGCAYCEGQGFAGRAPIGELLVVTPEVRQGVHQRRATSDLHQLAVAAGMVPMLSAGLERAARGETSLSELLRVAG
jgi:general secretion pathway protein E